MKHHHYICLLLLSLGCQLAAAQGAWVLKKEDKGIKIYSRSSGHSKFDDLRAELTVEAKLSGLAALILDITEYHSWCFNTKQSYIVKPVSPSELYFYTEINSPWPAKNRDLVVHLLISQDPATKIMTIREESVRGLVPPKKDIVRIPLSIEHWTVTPLDKDNFRIEYQLQLDAGDVPGWLVNFFATKGPYETFTSLRKKITEYRNASIPFIVNQR
jgi:hypothetical protein